jgi:genome maintenance exonuclease 1
MQPTFKEKLQRRDENIVFERPDFKFHKNFYNDTELDSVTTENGRYYTSPSGTKLVSVTTLLSKVQSDAKKASLERWRKRIGHAEAEKITKAAADRGTILHNLCEDFIREDRTFIPPKKGTNAFALFKQIYPCFKDINIIHGVEKTLYSERLGMAGKTDCIGEYKNELSIIDFKTTITEKNKSYIKDYFIQETAYGIMYADMYNLPVKQIVTLMAKDNGILSEPQIFVEKTEDYIDALFEKVRAYRKL